MVRGLDKPVYKERVKRVPVIKNEKKIKDNLIKAYNNGTRKEAMPANNNIFEIIMDSITRW